MKNFVKKQSGGLLKTCDNASQNMHSFLWHGYAVVVEEVHRAIKHVMPRLRPIDHVVVVQVEEEQEVVAKNSQRKEVLHRHVSS